MSSLLICVVLLCTSYPVFGDTNDLLDRLQDLDEERVRLEAEIKQYREKYRHLLNLYNDLQSAESVHKEEHGTSDENNGDEEKGRVVKRAPDCASIANKVVFHTRKSSTQTFSTSGEKIVFDVVHTNVGNGYDSHSGYFTVPISGNYQFLATAISSSGNFCDVEIYSSGNGMLCRTRAGDSHQAMGTCSSMSQETAGTEIYVRRYGSSGTVLFGNKYPSFSGHLISYDT